MISYARAVKIFYLWLSAYVRQIPSGLVKCDYKKLVTDIMQQAMHVKFSWGKKKKLKHAAVVQFFNKKQLLRHCSHPYYCAEYI